MDTTVKVVGGNLVIVSGWWRRRQLVLDLSRVTGHVDDAGLFLNRKELGNVLFSARYAHSLHAYGNTKCITSIANQTKLFSSTVLDVFADRFVAKQSILILQKESNELCDR